MDAVETLRYADEVARLRNAEIEFTVSLAKFIAGARIAGGAEVRG